jgi:5,10-methylenetetrahydromethanopterin reductase
MNAESAGERARMRFGVVLIATDPPQEFVRVVQLAEDLGFDDIWVADSSLHARDVYAYLTLCAASTKRVRIGVSVTQPFSRHPAVTANAIATIDEISGGRTILGIGAGDRPQRELGLRAARLAEIREMVDVTRALFRREPVDHRGGTYQLVNGCLRAGWRTDLPIYLAASGPRMLALAGEIGDGAIVRVGLSPTSVDYALGHLRAGLASGRRAPRMFDAGLLVNCCLYNDRHRAVREGRLDTAWYLQTAPAVAEAVGVDPEVTARVRAAYEGGHLHEAAAAAERVPEDLVQKFVLAGTPDEAVELIRPLLGKGLSRFEIFTLGPDRHQIMRVFGEQVMPKLR